MNSGKSLLLAEVVLVIALATTSWADYASETLRYLDLLPFALAFLIVDLFEVELPHGDASTMSTPILVTAVLFLTPADALVAIIVPGVAVQLFGRKNTGFSDAVHELLRRTILVLGAGLIASLLWGETQPVLAMARVFALAALLVLSDFLVVQLQTSVRLETPFLRLVLGSSRLEGTMMVAKVAAAMLAVLVYPQMHIWGLAALVILLLVMRQAFSSLVSVRRAYQSTIEALARTVEAQNPGKLGHAERVSGLATEVGRQLGLRGSELERLAYAALLHDLGEVGTELNESPSEDTAHSGLSAADMLAGVSFLSDVVPILNIVETLEQRGCESIQNLRIAYIVVAASRTDDLAQGEDVECDTFALSRLAGQFGSIDRSRIERAFRLVLPKIQGTLFALGGDQASFGQEE